MKTAPLQMVLFFVLLMGSRQAARAEWSLAAYLGGARPQTTSLVVDQHGAGTQLRFRDVEFIGDSFNSPLYYGYRAGYFFHWGFGLEAEFIHQKVFARVDRTVPVEGILRGRPLGSPAPLNTVVGRFSISHGLNLLLGNVTFRQDFWRELDQRLGRAMLTGRVGLGGTISHPESEVLGVPKEQYESGGLALQAAVGGEYRLWRGLYGIGEYKFTRTRQRLRIAAGNAETLLHSHHVIFGLAYHF